ncbi:MAG: hypothetical protein K2P81_07170 [Bacteriovoracaceae bacterium]|nr:hypothetical protein [Bacteriovoracaceae bacterium]
MKKMALLTSRALKNLIPDESRLLKIAKEHDLEFHPLIWDEPQDWKNFDAVVVRTPWDYVEKKEKFISVLKEIESLGVRLINPLKTLTWNFDKKYLLELQELGLPVPKTLILKQTSVIEDLKKFKNDVVVKPVISAGGFETYHLTQNDIKSFDWKKLPWDTHEFMAQEFLPAILTEGEYSLLFFNGEFSHALRKTPKQGEFRVQDDHGGRVHAWQPSKLELSESLSILNKIPYPFSYCRLDLAKNPEGKLMIMEIELIEPELFFRFSDHGEAKFVQSLLDYK